MRKIAAFAIAIFLTSATFAFAQDASNLEMANQASTQISAPKSPHSISVEYDFLTITDWAWALSTAIAGIFGDIDDSMFLPGAISLMYGYEVNEVFETGFIFNFAMPDENLPIFTMMPRAKLNFNSGGFFNPYMELDAGVSALKNGVTPMVHVTLIGFEIGRFYLQLLGWGQRGLLYAGLKF